MSNYINNINLHTRITGGGGKNAGFLRILAFLSCILFLAPAYATPSEKCPAGAFCINNGEYDNTYALDIISASLQKTNYNWQANTQPSLCTKNFGFPCDLIAEDYDQIWRSYIDGGSNGNFYLIKNGVLTFVYNLNSGKKGIFGCPSSHSLSEPGAKTVYECYTYDNNNEKIYFTAPSNSISKSITSAFNSDDGYIPLVICDTGYYMPANTNKCTKCSDVNDACPGGMFYVDKTYTTDRGKITCPNGVDSTKTACKPDAAKSDTTTTTTTTTTTKKKSGPAPSPLPPPPTPKNNPFDIVSVDPVKSATTPYTHNTDLLPALLRHGVSVRTPKPPLTNTNRKSRTAIQKTAPTRYAQPNKQRAIPSGTPRTK